jgi:hypothetical protein
MRLISFSVALALLSSASFGQQGPGTTVDKPAGPPQGQPTPQGYTGAYGPPGPATPYYTGPLPDVDVGTGLSVEGPHGTTGTVKAVPCGLSAQETDGTTTCVGIPNEAAGKRRPE